MSEKISNNNKGGVEEYKVLDEVYNADWRDDVPEEEDDAIKFEFEPLTDGSSKNMENDEADYDYETSQTSKSPGKGELIRIDNFNQKVGIKAIKAINLIKKAA